MEPRPSVALIDNAEARRDLLSGLLTGAGHEITVNGPHGIAAISGLARAAVQLVFVSFEEPLPRAIQTVEEVVNAAPDAIIVGFADEADTHAYRKAIAAGAKYLIDTPVSESEMRAVIDAVLPAAPHTPLRDSGSVVVVAGQKGGIGKTTISVNLASSLAHENRGSVLLVDLDPDFGDAGILMDLNTNISTSRASRDQAEFEFETFKRNLSMHDSGVFLLGAPQSFAERLPAAPADIESLIAFASRAFDYVLIDTPCVLNDTVMAALNIADVTLVTTTLEFASLRNTTLMLREMEHEGVSPTRTVVVANHIDPVAGFSTGDAAEILERESIWEVPYDRSMPRSTQLGAPLTVSHPKSAASKSLRALASRLGQDPAQIDRRIAVRGVSLAPPDVRMRLASIVRRDDEASIPTPAPPEEAVYVFSAGKRATAYHLEACAVGQRLADSSTALRAALPGNLRPCRVCLGGSAAA
jgi:pilus assembly protein CpaE